MRRRSRERDQGVRNGNLSAVWARPLEAVGVCGRRCLWRLTWVLRARETQDMHDTLGQLITMSRLRWRYSTALSLLGQYKTTLRFPRLLNRPPAGHARQSDFANIFLGSGRDTFTSPSHTLFILIHDAPRKSSCRKRIQADKLTFHCTCTPMYRSTVLAAHHPPLLLHH